MCAKMAGLVLRVLSDLLGHENHEVLSAAHPGLGEGWPVVVLPSPSPMHLYSLLPSFHNL